MSNQGVAGTILANLITGTDGKHLPWQQQMASSKAQVVVLNHGLNDAKNGIGESTEEYRVLLGQFVTMARWSGKIPVFDEPNPSCDPLRAKLPEYVAVMQDVAKSMQVPIALQYAPISAMPNWQSYVAKGCVHPNTALYAIKAERLMAVMGPVVWPRFRW